MKRSHYTVSIGLIIALLAACVSFGFAAEPDSAPPWKGQYKIKPTEKERLTAADVVGPDGIVYPNWTMTGLQGPVPQSERTVTLEQFGARADDDKDDSAALDKAAQAVGQQGGGVVLLGAGTYHLDLPVTIRHDRVVLRGQGQDKTKLVFRYALPSTGVVFYGLASGDRIGKDSQIVLHCRPTGLVTMTIELDGKPIHQWKAGPHAGNTFSTSVGGTAVVGRVPDGKHTLTGIAGYKDGTSLRTEIPVELDTKFRSKPLPDWRAAILFAGQGPVGPSLKLARDGRRGDRTLELESVTGLAIGDCIHLVAPATERWKRLVQNACKWGRYREYELQIEKIEGKRLLVTQPLRLDFPTIDGSLVRKVVPIRHCGVEGFHLRQTENLWITSVLFRDAWNCWARGVTIQKCGQFPVYGSRAKWCEIRDCTFDDAWFKGGGGTAYAGWEGCWDCLMENVTTYKLRHAPLVQWAASGNVIRKGVFHESDAQWHAGWTNENLMEQCVVESVRDHGSYGYGMWASPPEDTAHGPNGPRNVVYHCDVRSPRAGLWMGGMNEGWLILYNRFQVEKGEGVFGKTASFDHIVRGNVFVLSDPKSPMVQLATPDCIGWELIDNRLYGGNGQLASGKAKPAVTENNQILPAGPAPEPRPAVSSIYQWQQEHVKTGGK